MDEINRLLLIVECIDGPPSSRQDRMYTLIKAIRSILIRLEHRVQQLTEEAERYKALAEQRLLNHLQIDELHIIDIVNEVLPTLPTSELSQCTYPLDPEPIRIPPVPVEEIDFKHD